MFMPTSYRSEHGLIDRINTMELNPATLELWQLNLFLLLHPTTL